MSEWVDVSFGDLFDLIYRYPTYFGIEYVENGVPEIRGELLTSDGKILEDTRFISSETASRYPKVRLLAGDFVMSVRGTLGKIGLVSGKSADAVITANLLRLSPNRSRVDSGWLRQVFLSRAFQEQLENACSQTTIKTIQVPQLCQLRTNLPPLPEQRKIARILTTVDNLIEKTEALIAKYQAIKQGMMHDLFTRGVDEHGHLRPPCEEAPELYKQSELGWIPKEWEVGRLADTCALLRDGTHLPPPRVENGPLLLSVQNVIDGKLTLTSSDTRVPEDFFKVMHKSWQIAPGDVLLAIVGATIGKVCEVPEGIETFSIQRSLCLFRGKQSVLRTHYLYYYMTTPVFQAALWNRVNQTAQPGVYLAELGQLRIPLPLFAEQEEIARRLTTLTKRIESEERAGENLKSQKTGLMQDLLTGKVRVKVDEAEEVCNV